VYILESSDRDAPEHVFKVDKLSVKKSKCRNHQSNQICQTHILYDSYISLLESWKHLKFLLRKGMTISIVNENVFGYALLGGSENWILQRFQH